MPENRKIFRDIVFSNTAFIFSKRDIQHPMETIFYVPMTANCLAMDWGGEELIHWYHKRLGKVRPKSAFSVYLMRIRKKCPLQGLLFFRKTSAGYKMA